MNYSKIEKYLKGNLKKKRVEHTYGVAEAAKKLANLYGADENEAELAALLHDCGKSLSDEELIDLSTKYGCNVDEILLNQPQLLHGVAGAYIAKNNLGITNQEVLNAIQYHTIPRVDMTLLDKIVFVADIVEEGRTYDGVKEIREVAYKDLDLAFLMTLDRTMVYVLERKMLLHPDSVIVYNNMLMKLKKSDKI